MDNSLKQYMKMKNMNETAIKLSVLQHQPKIRNKINLNNRLEVLVDYRFISVIVDKEFRSQFWFYFEWVRTVKIC